MGHLSGCTAAVREITNMYNFTDIIEELEVHINDDIDIEVLAKRMNVSVYEFRRIFSFITGIPLGEYIRKRRLSLAALEMYKSKNSVAYYAQRYGYDSVSAFSRAFKEFHGIAPSGVIGGNNSFKLLTKISADIRVSGCNDIAYSIIEDSEFCISGVCAKSVISDTECCELAWQEFYNTDTADEITEHNSKIYAAYESKPDFVNCFIGERSEKYGDKIYIPPCSWACFKLCGTDDRMVNEFYNTVIGSFFSSIGYEKNELLPNVEIFPADMSEDAFEWEIRIPIKRSAE